MIQLRPLLSATLLMAATAWTAQAQDDAPPSRRQVVPMDSARARQLYVSNRPEDHPLANYEQQMAGKARTDSIFAARAKGVLKFSKITYKSQAGGMTIPAYLFEPLTPKGPRQHAAMVWVHGGVHGNMDQNYWPFIREAVERGYAIITPDYRGSTGFGKEHHNAIDYGGMEVDDVESAADVLKGLPYVNPNRLGVMGWSHGGYITALLLTREAQGTPFKSGAAIVPDGLNEYSFPTNFRCFSRANAPVLKVKSVHSSRSGTDQSSCADRCWSLRVRSHASLLFRI